MDGEFKAAEGEFVLKFVQLLFSNVGRGVSQIVHTGYTLSTSGRNKVAMPGVPLTCFLKMFKVVETTLSALCELHRKVKRLRWRRGCGRRVNQLVVVEITCRCNRNNRGNRSGESFDFRRTMSLENFRSQLEPGFQVRRLQRKVPSLRVKKLLPLHETKLHDLASLVEKVVLVEVFLGEGKEFPNSLDSPDSESHFEGWFVEDFLQYVSKSLLLGRFDHLRVVRRDIDRHHRR